MILTLVLLAQVTAATPIPPVPLKVVVLTDGSRYDLAKPYEIRGSQARLQLVNGPLVSVPVAQIDVAASQRAAAPPAAAPAPVAPQPRATARVVIGPDDVKAAPTPTPEPYIPGLRVAVATPTAASFRPTPATADAVPPVQNEMAWRLRYSDRRRDLKKAEADYADARATAVVSGYVGDSWVVEEAIKKALAPYQARVDDSKKSIKALQDECAATPGCAPGWVRD